MNENWWVNYRLRTVCHRRYKDRELGDLTQSELVTLSNVWLPRVAANWRQLSPDYRSDWEAISAAIKARSELG